MMDANLMAGLLALVLLFACACAPFIRKRKSRIDRDTDYEPHVKAWSRVTTDEEGP